MNSRDKFMDDLARMAGGTVNVFSGMTKTIREDIKSRIDEAVSKMDLVPREDFERLEAVLKETRKRVDEQEKRLSALEGKKAKTTPTTAKAKKNSSAKPKKTASKKPVKAKAKTAKAKK